MEKLNVTVENGIKTLEILTGEALPKREPTPVKICGSIDAPYIFLSQRKKDINIAKSHLLVNRDNSEIQLIINENDCFKTTVNGKLKYHPDYLMWGINAGEYITPLEMAEKIKMNRSFFENRQVAMGLVSLLRAFKAKINKEVDQEYDMNKGDRKYLLSQKVESNMPPSFVLHLPIFKGEKPRAIEVETCFNPDDLTCSLISPDANDIIKEIQDQAIDNVLDKIKEIAPDLVIIEK